jgi:hypothetical protein
MRRVAFAPTPASACPSRAEEADELLTTTRLRVPAPFKTLMAAKSGVVPLGLRTGDCADEAILLGSNSTPCRRAPEFGFLCRTITVHGSTLSPTTSRLWTNFGSSESLDRRRRCGAKPWASQMNSTTDGDGHAAGHRVPPDVRHQRLVELNSAATPIARRPFRLWIH